MNSIMLLNRPNSYSKHSKQKKIERVIFPVLFSGSIRTNMDIQNQYLDTEILDSLKKVHLFTGKENQNKFSNLDTVITEGGGNLSHGERQLVCLARSLLRNTKIILLDEAISSIDYNTDYILQQSLREHFNNLNILTIAHRLRTIIDYDKILVLDAGKVVEYDNPYVLITNTDSLFYRMCENSSELESLIKLAKEAYV